VQVRVIPVGEGHRAEAAEVRERLRAEGMRADADERDETVGKRVRDAEVEKVPYVVVWGDRESWGSMAVRKRGGEQLDMSGDALLDELRAVAKL
jgi:threonyl-tRNA synthetase